MIEHCLLTQAKILADLGQDLGNLGQDSRFLVKIQDSGQDLTQDIFQHFKDFHKKSTR